MKEKWSNKMGQSSSLKKIFALGAASLGALTIMGAANDAAAQSLQPRQCVSLQQFNETLIAEGQRTVIIGERTTIVNDPTSQGGVRTSLRVNGVSASADGRIGYQFEGDMPRGTPSQQVCIAAVLTNIEMGDARRGEILPRAYLGGPFNLVVNNAAQRGNYTMLVADTVFGTEGNRRYGRPIVVFGDMQDRNGSITTLTAEGPTSLAALVNLDYTQAGIERLNARQTASTQAATSVASLNR